MFSYGYSFEMGFLNFYISLGLAFFGIAIFWRGRGWERWIAVALAPLAMLAHPLGFAWLVAASAYVAMAEAIPRRYQILLVAAAGVVLFAARYYFWHHDIVQARDDPFYFFNGSDQLLLFGPRYAIPEFALLVFIFCALAADFFARSWGKLHWAGFRDSPATLRHRRLSRNPAARRDSFSAAAVRARATDRTPHLGFRRPTLLSARRIAATQMAPSRMSRR